MNQRGAGRRELLPLFLGAVAGLCVLIGDREAATQGAEVVTVTPICATELPAVAVWRTGPSLSPEYAVGPRALLAVWRDGQVIWSRDRANGGSPYLRARISPEAIESLLAEVLASDARENFAALNGGLTAADGAFTTITIRDDVTGQSFTVSSSLDDEADYVPPRATDFHESWLWLQERLRALLPSEGENAGPIGFLERRAERGIRPTSENEGSCREGGLNDPYSMAVGFLQDSGWVGRVCVSPEYPCQIPDADFLLPGTSDGPDGRRVWFWAAMRDTGPMYFEVLVNQAGDLQVLESRTLAAPTPQAPIP